LRALPVTPHDPARPAQNLILVGRVAGGFGVRGEVRIATYTEDPLTLTKFKVLTRQDGSPALTLTTARVAKDGVVARCVGIDTKEAADALRGLRLYVPREALPEPDEDEFYLADLIGLTVRHVATNDLIGKIKSVQNFGADDLLEITPALGGQTWYLPFTRAAVPEVKIAEGLVLADPPAMVGEPEGPVEDDQIPRPDGNGPRRIFFRRTGVHFARSRNSAMATDGKWRVTASRYIHKDRWIALRADDCLTEDGVPVAPYYVLEYPDWVEVVALDADDNVLLVRQYRHAMGGFSIELPAGGVDPADTDPLRRGGPRTAGGNRLRRRHDLGGRRPTQHRHSHQPRAHDPGPRRGPGRRAEGRPRRTHRAFWVTAAEAVRMALAGELVVGMHVGSLLRGLTQAGVTTISVGER
jgi:16S rRNA processing protein RimM